MPVLLDSVSPTHPLQAEAPLRYDEPCVEVALINNMPDAALESTERQFVNLLDSAGGNILVRLRLVSLPDIPRSDAARHYLKSAYADIAELYETRPDGIIVTGTEPRAQLLRDEPYWDTLASMADWADNNAVASVWSCLAAHAAVLHKDGVARRALADKCFGLFDCARVSDHPLIAGVPPRIRIAHSRWNELPEDELLARGYTILTRSAEAGVDSFAKEGKSLCLFFHGHPEYDERALLREYRRDIGRYLRRERDTYPGLPRGYFEASAVHILDAFRERALSDRREELMTSFPYAAVEGSVVASSGSPAARIYANWLAHLLSQKAHQAGARPRAGEARGRRVAAPAAAGRLG